ncbi:putative branched-chain amino acid transport system substrate-binding protein [Pusillimonas sp. T7-7]|uniref:ABC transporter substrate-binding protein n=1 Tax=Pusillimonas sp. (strain T7-7) TaxID=1007105 RepID=UPI0002084B8A|nr:ABC transporter substrate-binding protein [Pusillimonas sp. T7-7]AEC21119.1 putative branched-chain amino acid transport system substrate-binding protein [Pusillimonas sp. T7-7]
MKRSFKLAAAMVAVAGTLLTASLPAAAAEEQFVPLLAYRTGSFAPLGIPWADGKMDYLKLVNERDGGINGVKIVYEECETAYATDRGVECYERLKNSHGGASGFDTQSTGITFALTDKAIVDGFSIETVGYGLSQSADGSVFKWNFPLLGTYWTAADVMIQDIAKKLGGEDKLKGKKIALVYHDSPYGKEPITLLKARAEANGFELLLYPVTAPGVQQKSTWLQVRQSRPDFLLLWSAGIMTPTAIREAQAVGYPRDKMYGIWWASSENDVQDLGEVAKGYNGITIHNSADHGRVHEDLKKHVYDKGQGTDTDGKYVGTIAHTRGMMISMLQVEAIRTAQEKYGKGKHMTPEQVRWGFENLNITQERLEELGFAKLMKPVKTSCSNHMGDDWARIIQWNGSKFEIVSDWYQSDKKYVEPLVKELAAKYATEKKLEVRNCEG